MIQATNVVALFKSKFWNVLYSIVYSATTHSNFLPVVATDFVDANAVSYCFCICVVLLTMFWSNCCCQSMTMMLFLYVVAALVLLTCWQSIGAGVLVGSNCCCCCCCLFLLLLLLCLLETAPISFYKCFLVAQIDGDAVSMPLLTITKSIRQKLQYGC